MKTSEKNAWLAALRSGDYKQGTGCLHDEDNDEYCCLGVGAPIGYPGGHWTRETWKLTSGDWMGAFGGVRPKGETYSDHYLSTIFDLAPGQLRQLVAMNDDIGASFNDIADWIEANIETTD